MMLIDAAGPEATLGESLANLLITSTEAENWQCKFSMNWSAFVHHKDPLKSKSDHATPGFKNWLSLSLQV